MSFTTVINHLRYLRWLSKAVAVSNVPPLRCLGEYMAIALVIEAFLTLPHGLPARVHRVRRCRWGPKIEKLNIVPHACRGTKVPLGTLANPDDVPAASR